MFSFVKIRHNVALVFSYRCRIHLKGTTNLRYSTAIRGDNLHRHSKFCCFNQKEKCFLKSYSPSPLAIYNPLLTTVRYKSGKKKNQKKEQKKVRVIYCFDGDVSKIVLIMACSALFIKVLILLTEWCQINLHQFLRSEFCINLLSLCVIILFPRYSNCLTGMTVTHQVMWNRNFCCFTILKMLSNLLIKSM